jgi:hypothetical protein
MSVRFAGNGKNGNPVFEMKNDEEILKIDSPKSNLVGGPYVVVLKDVSERWAITAFDWVYEDSGVKQVLGIRWFWGGSGFPLASGFAAWTVLPDSLSRLILKDNFHKLSQARVKLVEDFLDGRISGQNLKAEFNKKSSI